MPERPTDKQLRLLRHLAHARGESFAYPLSRAAASREIERLLHRPERPRAVRDEAGELLPEELRS